MAAKGLLLLCLILMLRAGAASAQINSGFYRFYSFDIIKTQPLVVLLQEENPKELKKLANKPEELADYKGAIAYYNKQIQLLAPRFWKFSPSVEFQPESALKEIRAAKGRRTVVLRYEKHTNGASSPGNNSYFIGSRQVASMELTTPGNGDENYELSSPAPLDVVYPSDMVFAFRYIQQRLAQDMQRKARVDAGRDRQDIQREERAEEEAEVAANLELIRTRTLLIAENDLDPKLSAEGIRQFYPYPYQVVPRAAIEAAVQAGDNRYIYARRLAMSVELIGPFLIDAANSHLLARSASGGIRGGNSKLIGKDDFQDYVNYVKNNSK
jgi:hypothetical protein